MADYSKTTDLLSLYDKVVALRDDLFLVDFATFVVSTGLMRPTGFAAKSLWVAARVGGWLHKVDPAVIYKRVFMKQVDGILMAVDTVDQTVSWMLYGKDKSDPLSAGGFNKEEISRIVDFLDSYKKKNTL